MFILRNPPHPSADSSYAKKGPLYLITVDGAHPAVLADDATVLSDEGGGERARSRGASAAVCVAWPPVTATHHRNAARPGTAPINLIC